MYHVIVKRWHACNTHRKIRIRNISFYGLYTNPAQVRCNVCFPVISRYRYALITSRYYHFSVLINSNYRYKKCRITIITAELNLIAIII